MEEMFVYPSSLGSREIRLLRLHKPSLDIDAVRCDLEVVSLDNKPEFIAMSYVWGNPNGAKKIMLSGRKLFVTVNLYNALKTWRNTFENNIPDKSLRLWADAICINQKDSAEKNRQVAMMGEIYGSCSTVWIWMGEETEELHGSLNFVRSTCYKIFEEDFEDKPESKLPLVKHILQIDWRPLANLLRQPWFTRKWVIQEIVKAPKATMWIGEKFIYWDEFTILLNIIHNRGYNLVIPDFQVDSAHHNFGNAMVMIGCHFLFPKEPLSVDVVLRASAVFQATDSRDHLFAILGMTAQASDPTLAPDYSANFEEVCKRFASWHLKKGSVKFLCGKPNFSNLEVQPPALLSLPSWIPRIDCYTSSLGIFDYFAASKIRSFEGFTSENMEQLHIKGIRVDEIAELIDSSSSWLHRLTEVHSKETFQTKLQECKKVALGPMQQEFTPKQFEDFWQTMICERGSNSGERATPRLGRLFGRFMELIQGPNPPQKFSDFTSEQSLEIADLLAVLDIVLRFCRTKSGRLGQSQSGTSVRDIICVFFGAPTPFVLRSKGNGTFEFIGECYVHGIMDGEALDMGFKEEMFILV